MSAYEPRAGEQQPLGRMIPPVPAGVEIPPVPADVGARALSVAARLLCGASTFFFLAFVFAYFYLHSLNQNHMWRPKHVKPDQGLGAVFVACVVLSVVATFLAGRQMKAGSRSWTGAAIAGIVLGLLAIAFQCIAYTQQHFGPTDGAFASIFCAWTGFYMIAVLGTMYWLETQVATELRARRIPAHRTPEQQEGGDIAEPDLLIAPGLDAAVFYWGFLGGIGVLTYVVLYLV
jgi:heme/copper-type cytochrome/quinol oxidase subunit 3